jgi:formate dehydrogenase major subunit
MDITRRNFLKISGATAGVMLCPSLLKDAKAQSYAVKLKTKEGTDSTTICPYCACGCGIIVTASGGMVVNTEGDPDHPINEGTLCSKGNSLIQTSNSERRNTTVRWRPAGASDWREIPWGLAMLLMTTKIKRTRRRNFTKIDVEGNVVNRTEGIAAIGGAALDNEECYLYTKLMRSLGVIYLEHQARI